MNKYIRALVVVPTGFLKTLGLKVFHARAFSGVQLAQISPFTEITLAGGKLELGRGFKMRDGKAFFCRPYCSQAKDSIENRNKILR